MAKKKLSRTARYYKYGTTVKGKRKPKNAKRARKVKSKKDKSVNKRASQRKKRSELASRNRKYDKKHGKSKRKGKDYDHAVKRYVKSSTNRGRKGEGGRKKKKK